jgi:hypothetical protein
MAIRRLTSEFGTDLIAEGDIATGAVTDAKLAATLDLSSKTVTLPAAAVTAHVVVFDDNKIQANIALLGFKTAVNGTLAKYNLQDQIVDEYVTAAGINSGDSTNEVREGGAFSGVDPVGVLTDSATTYNISAGAQDAGALQSLTIRSDIVSVIIEAWGGRGGASENSWKKNSAGVIDNTSSISTAEEGGGYTVRMKGTFTGIDGGETLKIAVGKSASIDDSGGTASAGGCHSGGGGASWVFLDHGASSTIGQTRGVANNKQYTPLLVAGGGGGAGTRQGLPTYNQDQTPWTRHAETDANIATNNGATRLGTVVSPLTPANTGKYTTGTDDGEGGTSLTEGTQYYSGGGGAGFLADGARPVAPHNGYGGEESEGKHIFYDSVFTLVCTTGVPASSTTVNHGAHTFYVGTTMTGNGLSGGRTITAVNSTTSFTINAAPNFPSAQYGTSTYTFNEVAAIYGLKGGINTDTGSSYGDAFGGYGGGGAGSLSGAGGGGGFSGGSSTGTWTTDGANGIGGGSLFGSTIALSYNNVITYVENTNTLADDADVSPTTNKLDGRVIITEQYMGPGAADLILQSADTTAKSVPTTADIVMLIEDAAGTAVVDVNVKAYVSRYETGGGTKTWIQAPLVDEGTQVVGATTKRILVAHDVTLTGTSGTQMAYKIETLVQSAALNTKIHATSFGWK